MNHSAEFRRCLSECDISGVRRLWQHVAPNMPQPKSAHDALMAIHHARTQLPLLTLKQRAYSHRWLLDHGYPSGLPDGLKPSAERLYPKVVAAVGIAVKGSSPLGRQVAPLIQSAMSDAVLEAYADKKTDPAFVKARMMDARAKIIRSF